LAEGHFANANEYFRSLIRQRRQERIEPAPLGKLRSRDFKDDPYLSCALSARANGLVTRDSDLLVLQKPCGIEVMTPRTFLCRIATVV
jgi:predicted nucleic acid-binding protein